MRAMVTNFNSACMGYVIQCKYYHLNEYDSRIMHWFGPAYTPYVNYMLVDMIEEVSWVNPFVVFKGTFSKKHLRKTGNIHLPLWLHPSCVATLSNDDSHEERQPAEANYLMNRIDSLELMHQSFTEILM